MKVSCEVCNSENLVKEGDLFVCQDCGCKYSVEDIRRKLAIQTTQSDVATPNDKVTTYLELSDKERRVGNNKTALEYCEKALEIDLRYYPAWLQKGMILLTGEKIPTDRIKDAFGSLANAISYCPDSEKNDVERSIIRFLQDFQEDYISVPLERFGNTLSEEDGNAAFEAFEMFLVVNGSYVKERLGIEANSDEFYMSAWENISDTIRKIYKNQIYNPAQKLETYDGARWDFIQEVSGGFFKVLAVYPLLLSDESFKEPDIYAERRIKLLDEAVEQAEYIISNGGWVKQYRQKLEGIFLNPAKELSNKLKAIERKRKEAELKVKVEQYWTEHADEKASLDLKEKEYDQNIADLENEKSELKKQKKSLPEMAEISAKKKLISDKNLAINNLGFFKKKEKIALQEEITTIESEVQSLEDKKTSKEKELQRKIQALESKIYLNNAEIRKIALKRVNPFDN